MLTYIHHVATGVAVFEQSAMKIPDKIRDTRFLPPDVSSHCCDLDTRGIWKSVHVLRSG